MQGGIWCRAGERDINKVVGNSVDKLSSPPHTLASPSAKNLSEARMGHWENIGTLGKQHQTTIEVQYITIPFGGFLLLFTTTTIRGWIFVRVHYGGLPECQVHIRQ